MNRSARTKGLAAAVSAIAFVLAGGCAHENAYGGGTYAKFTFSPRAPALSSDASAQERDAAIQRDERLLAEGHDVDRATLRHAFEEVVPLLCAANQKREMRRVIETYAVRAYGTSHVALSFECGFHIDEGTPPPHRNGRP